MPLRTARTVTGLPGMHSVRGALCVAAWAALAVIPAAAGEPALRSELVFPLDPQHNHAPGIAELPDHELVVSWYRGSGERSADDVAVWGSRLKPGASEWSTPTIWADTPGFPDCNTCLHVDERGRLWLFWPVILANSWESALTQYRVSEAPGGEGCPAWSAHGTILLKPEDFRAEGERQIQTRLDQGLPLPDDLAREIEEAREKLKEPLYQRLGWQPRCKPTVLPSGRMLLPLYSDTFSASIMAISDDQGATWFASRPLLGLGNIQPSVFRRNDGTLVAFMRENGGRGHIRVSESHDEGLTWSPVESSELPNPGSGLDGVRLSGGEWVLVYNDAIHGRRSLAVSLSHDEGRTWAATRWLERQEQGAFHYPAVIQTTDGMIHCVYSYFVEGGKSMKHAAFNREWIEAEMK